MTVNLGDYANDEDMHHNVETGKKAVGVGTAIAPGKGVFHTQATGLWAITGAGSSATARTGIIPNKDPLNTDSNANIQVETRKGTGMYVQAGGAINPNGRCIPDASGKFIAAGGTAVTGVNEYVYEGHEGEGGGLFNTPTVCSLDEKIRVRIA
jgi:hypothetical protein